MSGNVLGKIIGRTLGILCLTAALAACNDGSSGSSTADAASAGSAQTVTVAANTAYSFHPQVASSAGSYSIVHKPAWANFNTITGELSGTPTSADTGQYSNIIISADANGSSLPLPPLSIIVTPAATPHRRSGCQHRTESHRVEHDGFESIQQLGWRGQFEQRQCGRLG